MGAGRRSRALTAEERALWGRVVASVRPLSGVAMPVSEAAPEARPPERVRQTAAEPPLARPAPRAAPGEASTLDGGWDRRLARGMVSPETVIDLHGHSLASAHALLDAALERAIARGDRVLLLVTGKPPRVDSERPHARGAIRAAVGDWLAASRHSSHIAAIRQANVRHGGVGALYIVLRRPKLPPARKS